MRKGYRRIKILAAVSGGFVLAGTAAMAAYETTGRSINILTTADFSNRIVEQYQAPDHLNPGQSMDKIVYVENDGGTDSFVRIKVTKVLGARDEQGSLIQDQDLDPEMLEIAYVSDAWKYKEDGYWYYMGILKAGEKTREPLFKSCRLSERAGNKYKNKEGEILVAMESIQAGGDALEALWDMKEEELGVEGQVCRSCKTVTKVSLDDSYKIQIEGADGDLFANFKNLLPGCSRTQSISLSNQSRTDAELYLRAEETEQEKMTEEERKRVDLLLNHYTFIEVRQGGKVLYQGPVGGQAEGGGNTMRQNIRLGQLEAGETQSLEVTLTASPEMDNAYQKLMGKVCWVFSAAGEEEKIQSQKKAQDPSSSGKGKNQDKGGTQGEDAKSSQGNRNPLGDQTPSEGGGDGGSGSGSGSYGAAQKGYGEMAEGKISPKTEDMTKSALPLLLTGSGGLAAAAVMFWKKRREGACDQWQE